MFRSHVVVEVPGKEFVDHALHVTACDGGEGRGQPPVRIDGVQFAGLDKGSDDSPVFGPGVMAGEERVLSRQGDGADGAFDGIAVKLDPAIGQEHAKAIPILRDVGQGFAEGRFSRDTGALQGEPCLEVADDRR